MEMYRGIAEDIDSLRDRGSQRDILRRVRNYADEMRELDDEPAANAIDRVADLMRRTIIEESRPQGHATGGLIQSYEGGGRIEPTVPSTSVNDQSKPVEPVKKIHNPDTPGFKDIFIRERSIRGGVTPSGGPSADMKQIMNPRNIVYKKGGSVSKKPVYFADDTDAMRYEMLRKNNA
jgi:hypothetical protein